MSLRAAARTPSKNSLALRGLICIVRHRRSRCFFGFTKANPFADQFEVKAAFRRRRATSSRSRPCASPASTSARSRRSRALGEGRDRRDGDDGAQRRRACRCKQRRDGQGPPAHLPRGQLLRRRAARLAVRAGRSKEGATIPATQTAAPGRPRSRSSRRCRATRARTSRSLLQEFGTRDQLRRRRRLPPLDPVLGARVPRLGDRQRRHARQARARPLELPQGRVEVRRGPGPQPRAAQDAHHRLRRRPPTRSPTSRTTSRAAIAPAARARSRTGRRALGALNDAFPPLRRLVADLRPAVRSSRPALDATLPVRPRDARARLARPSCAAWSRDLKPDRARPGRAQPRRRRAAGAAAPAVELPEQRRQPVAERHGARPELPVGRAGLPGGRQVVPGHRRREPLVRRQRPVRPLAGQDGELRLPGRRRALLPHRPAAAGRQPAEAGPAAAARPTCRARRSRAAGPAHEGPGAAAAASASTRTRPAPPSAASGRARVRAWSGCSEQLEATPASTTS